MCDSCRIAGRRCAPPWRGKENTAIRYMSIFNLFKNGNLENSSPVLMVSAADLKEALRGIFEEFIVADGEKEDELLTVRQASALLDVDRSTLWRWEKEGYLRPIRIGRKVRYQLSAV